MSTFTKDEGGLFGLKVAVYYASKRYGSPVTSAGDPAQATDAMFIGRVVSEIMQSVSPFSCVISIRNNTEELNLGRTASDTDVWERVLLEQIGETWVWASYDDKKHYTLDLLT